MCSKKLVVLGFGGLNGATQVGLNFLVNMDLPAAEKAFIFYGKTDGVNTGFLSQLDEQSIDSYQIRKNAPGLDFQANMEVLSCLRRLKPKNLVLSSRAPILGITWYKLLHPTCNIVSIEQQPLNHTSKKEYIQAYLGLLFFNKLVPPTKSYADGFLQMTKPLSNLFKKKMNPIANGLPAPAFRKENTNRGDDNFTILGMAARFDSVKDFDSVVRAIHQLNLSGRKNYKFLMAGDGVNRLATQELVRSLGLEDQVEYLGLLDKEALHNTFYNRLDIYVQSSSGEAMSVSMMEAMSYGLIFIGSNVRGIADFIDSGYNGLLFEHGNVDSLVSQIEFATIPSNAKKLSEGALNYFRERFSLSKMVQEYSRLLH